LPRTAQRRVIPFIRMHAVALQEIAHVSQEGLGYKAHGSWCDSSGDFSLHVHTATATATITTTAQTIDRAYVFLLLQSDNFGSWVWMGRLTCCHCKLQPFTARSKWGLFSSLAQRRSEPSSPSETLDWPAPLPSLFFSLLAKMAPSLSERADLAISSHWQVV
jgi:hypothetical protein